jgi:hypothetical protein
MALLLPPANRSVGFHPESMVEGIILSDASKDGSDAQECRCHGNKKTRRAFTRI